MNCYWCGRECDVSPCLDCFLGMFEAEDFETEPLPPRRPIVDIDTGGLL